MMSGQITADIGQWYRPINSRELFEVVAIDYEDQTVEVQHFDGDIEELEFNTWRALLPVVTAPPEDWTGPYEIESEDPSFNAYAINEVLLSIDGDAS